MISAKTHHDAQEMQKERERGRVSWREAKFQRMQVYILFLAAGVASISPRYELGKVTFSSMFLRDRKVYFKTTTNGGKR